MRKSRRNSQKQSLSRGKWANHIKEEKGVREGGNGADALKARVTEKRSKYGARQNVGD